MASSDEDGSCGGPDCNQQSWAGGVGGGGGGSESDHPISICPPTPGSEESQCAHLTDYVANPEAIACKCPGPGELPKNCKVTVYTGPFKGAGEDLALPLGYCHSWVVVERCDGTSDRYEMPGAEHIAKIDERAAKNRQTKAEKPGFRAKIPEHLGGQLIKNAYPNDAEKDVRTTVCTVVQPCLNDVCKPNETCCDKFTDKMMLQFYGKDAFSSLSNIGTPEAYGGPPMTANCNSFSCSALALCAVNWLFERDLTKEEKDAIKGGASTAETGNKCMIRNCMYGGENAFYIDFFGQWTPGGEAAAEFLRGGGIPGPDLWGR